MKVSLNTAKFHSNVDVMPNGLDDLVLKIGAQLGAIEEVVEYSPRYDRIVVAKVVTCQKHPNADKLSVCTIDDGGITPDVNRDEHGYVQVVCGAPNVRECLIVAWIPPGAIVPATYSKDPFVLEARELRGVVSNGMLASASELGISDDHSGLLEINAEDVGEDVVTPGTPFSKLYGLDDVVIEIENKMFTHRPDCFGVLGVAREIAGIYGQTFHSPDWYKKPIIPQNDNFQGRTLETRLSLEVQNELPELVPRFMVVAMSGVEVKPSPIWMRACLTRLGVKPINNIVDITNYLAYVTAQPLHAYDYDKVLKRSEGTATLVIRFPNEGEKVALLNGKTITPRAEAIMIATNKELIGMGGVMGGKHTEVDENTKNIILECANFDMYNIRRTSMAHGLFTDAVTRNTKGQSPLQNDRVLHKAISMMSDLAGAKQAGNCIDSRSQESRYETQKISVEASFINQRLGLELKSEEISRLLNNVEFSIELMAPDSLLISAPFWRTDIQIKEDIVEEVGRLYGYDKLREELPKKGVSPSLIEEKLVLKKQIRNKLASLGANEVLTYSFVHGDLFKKVGQDSEIAFKINNALSPDLQYYRLSLTPNLLSHVHSNIKANNNKFAMFEVGVVHSKTEIGEDKVPTEFGRVALVLADKNTKETGFYQARAFIDQLGFKNIKYQKVDAKILEEHKMLGQMFAPYDPARSAYITSQDGRPVGVVGEYKADVLRNFKLPKHCAGFEIFISSLKHISKDYQPLSRYPSISQDVCLEVEENTTYGDLENAINESINNVSAQQYVVNKNLIDIFADENIKGKKRITFRFNINSYDRTLTEDSVSILITDLITKVSEKINAVRI